MRVIDSALPAGCVHYVIGLTGSRAGGTKLVVQTKNVTEFVAAPFIDMAGATVSAVNGLLYIMYVYNGQLQ